MNIYRKIAAAFAMAILALIIVPHTSFASQSILPASNGGISSIVEQAVKEQTQENSKEVKASSWKEGDVVGFLGDSITHYSQGTVGDNFKTNYIEYLYNYYISRYPDKKIELRNLGADSYRTKHMIATYGVDPETKGLTKATIMLGMNEGRDKLDAKEYGEDIEKLIDLLLTDGLKEEDILLMSPTICVADGTLDNSIDNCLKEYTKELERISKERGISYLDLHTKFVALFESGKGVDFMYDSIHPNAIGEMLIAGYMLEYFGAEDTFSEILLYPENSDKKTEVKNAKVSITHYYANGFKLQAAFDSLPMAMSEDMKSALSLIPTMQNLGALILKADGLSELQEYDLYCEDVKIGTVTGAELKDGIDISKFEGYPLYEVAQNIEEINQNRQEIASYYRQSVKDTCYNNSMTAEALNDAVITHAQQDEELRNQMYDLAAEGVRTHFGIKVVESGVSPKKLSGEYETPQVAEPKAEEEQSTESSEQEGAGEEPEQKSVMPVIIAMFVIAIVSATAAGAVIVKRKR